MKAIPNKPAAIEIGMAVVLMLTFVACSEESSGPGITTQPQVAGEQLPHPAADPLVLHGSAPDDEVFFEPLECHMHCDSTTSTFTVEGAQGAGEGWGPTRTEAMRAAVRAAIEGNAWSQFTCENCPNNQPCEPFTTDIDEGGAFFENPEEDCAWDEERQLWNCFGGVNFGSGGGPEAAAECGCQRCPAPRPTVRVIFH